MSRIADRIVALHQALDAAGLPHAFGGALALAWCTGDPRGTSDIDLNVFVAPTAADAVLAAMPGDVACSAAQRGALRREGQVRLFWDEVPVDLFLDTSPFHEEVSARARVEPFAGTSVPFLACDDLAVFKALFDRTRDWADLEDMAAAGTLDREHLHRTLAGLLGAGDGRLARLERLPWRG